MRAILGCVAVLALIAGLTAEDKKDKKADSIDPARLVGRWEPKDEKQDRKVVVEFAKGGKMEIRFNRKGEESKVEGTYKVEGNKLTVTLKVAGVDHDRTQTISKLTDAELVGTDEKGKEETLLRLKDK